MLELVVRRGREFFEWRFRDEADSKFRTTKIATRPTCQKPARCRWCEGIPMGPILLDFPVRFDGLRVYHVVTPVNGCHLTAMEYAEANPNQPIKAGWILNDEEKEAGRFGQPWPEDI